MLTRSQAREVDVIAVRDYGLSTLVLMENAGRSVADKLIELGYAGAVAICCGKGNNGGDGFVIARHLDNRGIAVRVLGFFRPDELQGDAAVNFDVIQKSGLAIELFESPLDGERLENALSGAAVIVDCLLGTGAVGEPRSPIREAIDALNRHPADKIAVDLPSGLDCDTGQPAEHTIRAAHTCTFVASKQGFAEPGAAAFTGQVHVLDIGVPRKLLAEL